jgi:hypothetical protein
MKAPGVAGPERVVEGEAQNHGRSEEGLRKITELGMAPEGFDEVGRKVLEFLYSGLPLDQKLIDFSAIQPSCCGKKRGRLEAAGALGGRLSAVPFCHNLIRRSFGCEFREA